MNIHTRRVHVDRMTGTVQYGFTLYILTVKTILCEEDELFFIHPPNSIYRLHIHVLSQRLSMHINHNQY